MVNPFDPKTLFMARHAQHVVLIHFPIALFVSAVMFDCLAQWKEHSGLDELAYYNLLLAALSTVPALITGILAWQLQLEGGKLKGTLLLHLVFGCCSSVFIWIAWRLHARSRRNLPASCRFRLALELLGVVVVALTGHLGGFLSGVNGPS